MWRKGEANLVFMQKKKRSEKLLRLEGSGCIIPGRLGGQSNGQAPKRRRGVCGSMQPWTMVCRVSVAGVCAVMPAWFHVVGHATGRNRLDHASWPESGSHPSRVSPTRISKKNHYLMSNFQQRYVLRFWVLHSAKRAFVIAVTSLFPPCADPRSRLSSEGS